MSNELLKYAIEQAKSHGWEEYLFALICIGAPCFIVGYGMRWWTTQRKTNAETIKLEHEGRKAAGDNVEKLERFRNESNSKREILDLTLVNMRNALSANKEGTKNANALQSCRDEMCNVYANEYLPAVNTYVELIPKLVDPKEARLRAEIELIPGLQTSCRFLKMVNMEAMIKESGSKPWKLNKARWRGALARVKALIPWWCFGLRWKMRIIRKETDIYLRQDDL